MEHNLFQYMIDMVYHITSLSMQLSFCGMLEKMCRETQIQTGLPTSNCYNMRAYVA